MDQLYWQLKTGLLLVLASTLIALGMAGMTIGKGIASLGNSGMLVVIGLTLYGWTFLRRDPR